MQKIIQAVKYLKLLWGGRIYYIIFRWYDLSRHYIVALVYGIKTSCQLVGKISCHQERGGTDQLDDEHFKLKTLLV